MLDDVAVSVRPAAVTSLENVVRFGWGGLVGMPFAFACVFVGLSELVCTGLSFLVKADGRTGLMS